MSADTTKSPNGSVAEISDILINGIDSPEIVDSEDVENSVESDKDEVETPIDSESDENQELEGEKEEESDMTWGKALGVDDSKIVLDEEGNLKGVNITIDGEVSQVDMNTLINGFQFNTRNTKVSNQLSAERKEFEQLRSTAAQSYANKLTEAQKITEYLGNQLMQDYHRVDWQGLRATDPAEYAARIQDYNLKNQEIQQLYANINQNIEQEKAQRDAENQQQMQHFLQSQFDVLVSKNPEWSDTAKMREAFDEMADFAENTYGINQHEFESLVDARQIEVLRDAMAYRKGRQIGSKKIEKPLPKFVKSSGSTPKTASKLDILTKAAKSATGQAGKKLSQAAIAELLMNG